MTLRVVLFMCLILSLQEYQEVNGGGVIHSTTNWRPRCLKSYEPCNRPRRRCCDGYKCKCKKNQPCRCKKV